MAKGFSRTVCQNHLSGSLSWWVILVWELTRFLVVCNKEQGWLLYKGTFSGEWEGETFRRETDTGDILGCLQWSTVEWAITGMERARAHCSHQWCNGLSLEIPKQTGVHGWIWWVKVPGKPRGTPVAASSVADFSYERREAEKGPMELPQLAHCSSISSLASEQRFEIINISTPSSGIHLQNCQLN